MSTPIPGARVTRRSVDRGVVELRWAALNLGLMVTLAAFTVIGGGGAAGRFGAAGRWRGGSGR